MLTSAVPEFCGPGQGGDFQSGRVLVVWVAGFLAKWLHLAHYSSGPHTEEANGNERWCEVTWCYTLLSAG